MLELLSSFFARAPRPAGRFDESIMQNAIERAVDGTDPRLRAISGYAKRMRPAVEKAAEYVDDLVESLPPPVSLARAHFAAEPCLRAFFASADSMRKLLDPNQNLRAFLRSHPGSLPDGIFALLGMRWERKTVFAPALEDEGLRQDVAQREVNFFNHNLVGCAGSERDTRWELKKRAFDHLLEYTLRQIVGVRARRADLERQRSLLQRKLRTLEKSDWALAGLAGAEDVAGGPITEAQAELAKLEAELLAVRADNHSLDDVLEKVVRNLGEPERHLYVHNVPLHLDHRGIEVPEGTGQASVRVILQEVAVGEERRAITLVHYPPDEPPAEEEDLLARAARLL
jgi:hypothetical protein